MEENGSLKKTEEKTTHVEDIIIVHLESLYVIKKINWKNSIECLERKIVGKGRLKRFNFMVFLKQQQRSSKMMSSRISGGSSL